MSVAAAGISKKSYRFEKFPLETTFDDINAVYMYAREESKGGSLVCIPIYIGMSTGLGKHLANHAYDGVLDCALKNGANCFLVHQPEGLTTLTAIFTLEKIERDLLDAHETPCNTQCNL